jgi:hypothetical protein
MVRVRAIDPERYARFMRYSGHPSSGMTLEERLRDITASCAQLWARTCQDMAGREPDSEGPRLKAA